MPYLSSRGTAVLTGLDVLRAPADRCPGPRRAALNRRDVRPGDPYRLRCPFAEVRVAFAVAPDAAGRPRLAGR